MLESYWRYRRQRMGGIDFSNDELMVTIAKNLEPKYNKADRKNGRKKGA